MSTKDTATEVIATTKLLFPEFCNTKPYSGQFIDDTDVKHFNINRYRYSFSNFFITAVSLFCFIAIAPQARSEEEWHNFAEPWTARWLVALYAESNDRVTATEVVLHLDKVLPNGNKLSVTGLFDSLTGASPTGAVPSPLVQTIARPSGEGRFDVPANAIPQDDTFKDTRFSGGASIEFGSTKDFRWGLGGNFSNEYDYQSISFNSHVQWDFNKKNTTFGINFSSGTDTSSPVGSVPKALEMVPEPNAASGEIALRSSSDTRTVNDILFSFLQTLSPRSLLQVNLSIGQSSGYLNDPYKVLSVVSNSTPSLGAQTHRIYEKRPDSRERIALYSKLKQKIGSTVMDVSYRYGSDDWGIASNTFELKWRLPVGGGQYIRPIVRLYQQEAADFYRQFLIAGEDIPTFASADARLGSFSAQTIGPAWGISEEKRFAFEYYNQEGDTASNAFGYLAGRKLFPDLSALIVRYSFDL